MSVVKSTKPFFYWIFLQTKWKQKTKNKKVYFEYFNFLSHYHLYIAGERKSSALVKWWAWKFMAKIAINSTDRLSSMAWKMVYHLQGMLAFRIVWVFSLLFYSMLWGPFSAQLQLCLKWWEGQWNNAPG